MALLLELALARGHSRNALVPLVPPVWVVVARRRGLRQAPRRALSLLGTSAGLSRLPGVTTSSRMCMLLMRPPLAQEWEK